MKNENRFLFLLGRVCEKKLHSMVTKLDVWHFSMSEDRRHVQVVVQPSTRRNCVV